MIVVIQCAATKRADAGRLRSARGVPVEFVANPRTAPVDPSRAYARPDDLSDHGASWRQVLLQYNREADGNPLGLCPAFELYQNGAYRRLADRFGLSNLYILSAGWGLIDAKFLTPYYDITYSQSAEDYKQRRQEDRYDDFRMLPGCIPDTIVFFGEKEYLPMFCALTCEAKGRKFSFFNSAIAPQFDGCTMIRFEKAAQTNWHYECVNAFLNGDIRVDFAR